MGERRGGNGGRERIGDLGGRTLKRGEDYERDRKERKDERVKWPKRRRGEEEVGVSRRERGRGKKRA